MKVLRMVIINQERGSGIVNNNSAEKSMINPGLGELLKRADSRYTLVVVVAKRARKLNDGAEKLVQSNSDKVVAVAIDEVNEGKITFIRTKSGIK